MQKKFETKVFWTIFLSAVVISSSVVLAINFIFCHFIRQQFYERYTKLSRVLGNSIVQAEIEAEKTMRDAAYIIQDRDKKREPLPEKDLRSLAAKIGVTHIFMVDESGKFTRSTNEDPSLIPNLFSFCADYKKMLTGDLSEEATPIIPPTPEPKPYKFLTIPNPAQRRLIHIGLRIDFLSDLLGRALTDDANVSKISIFAPNGTSLGSFGPNEKDLSRTSDPTVKDSPNGLKEGENGFMISTWIPSGHPHCCQCTTAGNTRKGQYDYLIRVLISKEPLSAALQAATRVCILFGVLTIAISFLMARFLSDKVVRRLKYLTAQVREISAGAAGQNLIVSGSDEVFELGSAFNELMKNLREMQWKLVEAEKEKSLGQLARQVAHDIRSPVSALNIAYSVIRGVPEKQRDLIKQAADRISQIADDLLFQGKKKSEVDEDLNDVLEAVLNEKKLELRDKFPAVQLGWSPAPTQCLVRMKKVDFLRCISNLLNNAVESCADNGKILVAVEMQPNSTVEVAIEDNGCGIPDEIIRKLGNQEITHGKEFGTGIGFLFAQRVISQMNGSLDVKSQIGQGTRVSMQFRTSVHRGPKLE